MTAVYNNVPQLPPRRSAAQAGHFGGYIPIHPYAAGRSYKQATNDGSNTFATGRAYVQSAKESRTPSSEAGRPIYRSATTSAASPRPPPLPRRQTPAVSAPPATKGNDYFGQSTPPRQARSAPAERLPPLGGTKALSNDSLLNDFLSLPPMTVTLEALFYLDYDSSCWYLATNLPLHYVKTVDYDRHQYVDGVVNPQCISAAFLQQKVAIKAHHFGPTEKKVNHDKQCALNMYGAKQIDQWGKKIRVRAEIEYPRKMAFFGSKQRGNGQKTFKIIDAVTLQDMFPRIDNLPPNFDGNRQASYVKR